MPSQRLQRLCRRYGDSSEDGEPAGIAFHTALARYAKANRETLLDVVMAATAAHLALDAGPDAIDPLLLKAISDTNPSLSGMRLFELDDDSRQAAVNAAKGKYFEYLVADRLNRGEQVGPLLLEEGFHARLADSPTQPGWDLQIVDSRGVVADYFQLKATGSVAYVREALERYPDIEILATHEVSGADGLVLDSSLSNEDLNREVGAAIGAVDASVGESFLDYLDPLLPLVAITLGEGHKVVIGRQSLEAFKSAMGRRGQRIVAANVAGAAMYALGGGLLAVPAAFAGGLWFDHHLNRSALGCAFAGHRRKLLNMRLRQQDRMLSGAWQ